MKFVNVLPRFSRSHKLFLVDSTFSVLYHDSQKMLRIMIICSFLGKMNSDMLFVARNNFQFLKNVAEEGKVLGKIRM